MDSKSSELDAAWRRRLQAQIGREYPAVHAWDPVDAAMIRHWCEALGDANPLYTDAMYAVGTGRGGIVAPPAMLRSWLLPGYGGKRPPNSGLEDATIAARELFREGGYSGEIGVGTEDTYLRDLHPGDHLNYTSVLETVSELKSTRLGPGYFFAVRMDVFDQRGRAVGMIRSRELAYRRAPVPARS